MPSPGPGELHVRPNAMAKESKVTNLEACGGFYEQQKAKRDMNEGGIVI